MKQQDRKLFIKRMKNLIIGTFGLATMHPDEDINRVGKDMMVMLFDLIPIFAEREEDIDPLLDEIMDGCNKFLDQFGVKMETMVVKPHSEAEVEKAKQMAADVLSKFRGV